MIHLIGTEALKLRTTRSLVGAVASAAVFGGLVAVAILTASGHQGNDPLGPQSLTQILGGPAGALTLVSLLLGVLLMAGEYRHGTITTTFLGAPQRHKVVIAKLVTGALAGAAMAILSLAVSAAIAVPWLVSSGVDLGIDGGTARVGAGLVTSTALYTALGVAVGTVVRNQTAAAATVLVWLLTAERLVGMLPGGSEVARWLPAAAGRAIVHVGPEWTGPPALAAAGALAASVGFLGLAGARLTVHGDIS